MEPLLSKNSPYLSFFVFGYVFSGLAFTGVPSLSKIAFFFFCALSIFLVAHVFSRRISVPHWVFAPLFFLVLCAIFTTVGSDSASDTLTRLTVAWGGATAVTLAVRKLVPMRVVLAAMASASLVNTIAIFLGFDAYLAYAPDLSEIWEEAALKRPSGLVGNANLMAVHALLPVFALAVWPKQAGRILWFIIIACAAYAVLISGSRKGLLLGVAAIIAISVSTTTIRKKHLKLVAVSFVIFLTAFFLTTYAGPEFEQNIREVVAIDRVYLALEGRDKSFEERYDFIGIGLTLFADSPLWGHGVGMFSQLSGTGLYSHNNFIELAVSGGFLLLASYYGIHLTICLRTRKSALHRIDRGRPVLFLLAILIALDFSMVSFDTKIVPLLLMLLLDDKNRFSAQKIRAEG